MKHVRSDYDRIQDPSGKIPEDEPVFLLRAQDKHFVSMLVIYAQLLATNGGDVKMVKAVMEHAQLGQKWPTKRSPDMPEQS